MNRCCRIFFAILIVLMGAWPAMAQSEGSEGMLVGRVSHVEGQLLRFVPETKDWVATIKDAPFGLNDALYSDQQGKAEFIMPNNTWVRIGGNTQAQLITLKPDVTEVDIASGSARFYNRSSNAVVKATTPFGYVLAQSGGSFDLYVGDQSLEVIALQGEVSYIHGADQSKYDVVAGASSVIADKQNVTTGAGNLDADWDDWNADRDRLWAKRLDVRGDSTKYLPEPLHDDAYSLEENGKWERVYYEGEYREYWRPTSVSSNWAPFTAGRWADYYEDQCWVPDEPFGYVTHHYGNWVMVDGRWFWAPPAPPPPPVPVVGVAVGPVAIGFGLGWNPGRVGWIHSGDDVGWVPLAPSEPYYGHHHWGGGAVMVNTAPLININIGNYAYVNHAVVVPQTQFYGVNNYSSVRVTNINKTTIINNYNAAPVVNNTVIKNYNTTANKYNFTNVAVDRKPHEIATQRIQANQQVAKTAQNVTAKTLTQDISKTKPGVVQTAAKVPPPQVTSKIVPKADVAKPANQVKFDQKPVMTKPEAGCGKSRGEIPGSSRRSGQARHPPKAGAAADTSGYDGSHACEARSAPDHDGAGCHGDHSSAQTRTDDHHAGYDGDHSSTEAGSDHDHSGDHRDHPSAQTRTDDHHAGYDGDHSSAEAGSDHDHSGDHRDHSSAQTRTDDHYTGHDGDHSSAEAGSDHDHSGDHRDHSSAQTRTDNHYTGHHHNASEAGWNRYCTRCDGGASA